MKILYNFTTRSRPDNFKRGLQSIITNSVSDDYHILVSIDGNDSTMNNVDMLTYLANEPKVSVRVGNSNSKIDAINRDVNDFTKYCDWDIIVNMSDDMMFTVKGFDDIIRQEFKETLAEDSNGEREVVIDLDQALHFPDQHQGANCMSLSILGREYYNRDMFIYNPAFESLWVDIVAQEEAQIRGCYKFVNQNIFLHLHPSFGDCAYDSQYQKTEDWGVRQRDYATYLRLKQVYDKDNRFPIRSI